MAEHRLSAAHARPVSKVAAAVIAVLWCLFIGILGWWAYRYFTD
jgi:hypothetical protein